MVALLLENGATIDAKTRDGLTPLHCAARSGHEQVVDMLLEKGAPISSKTKVSNCHLSAAISSNATFCHTVAFGLT